MPLRAHKRKNSADDAGREEILVNLAFDTVFRSLWSSPSYFIPKLRLFLPNYLKTPIT